MTKCLYPPISRNPDVGPTHISVKKCSLCVGKYGTCRFLDMQYFERWDITSVSSRHKVLNPNDFSFKSSFANHILNVFSFGFFNFQIVVVIYT